MDVQRKWPCSLVTSLSDVRHCADMRVLQINLQNNVLNKWQFEFVKHSWKHSSKLLYKLSRLFSLSTSYLKPL